MFGFPIGNGNSGFNDFMGNFTSNPNSGFPNIQKKEIFYTIKDGNWNDLTVWQTASGRIGIFPTSIDVVYIRHTIIGNTTTTINNLFVTGNLSVTVTIGITFNNIRCYGRLINNGGSFRISGNQNYIEKSLYQFISGDLQYIGNNQEILDLNYGNLYLSGAGTKYLARNLVVNNNFQLNSPATFDAYGHDITINGTTSITSTMNATGNGNYLFIGAASLPVAGINFVGNPTMEFRSGLGFGSGTFTSNLGAGNISFTTNNQSVTSGTSGLVFNNPISIASGLTLTFPSNTTTTFNSTINGLSGTSKLVNSGGSNLVFTTQNGCENLMATGTYDFTTSANTITFGGNYSATIPSYFTTFHNLTISGTGTKTLGVNTTLNGNSITGTTSCTTGTLSKNGAGNVLFVGNISTALLDFSGGNPNVEVRGGIIFQSNSFTFNTGTGTWTFSTNNQSLVRATSVIGLVNFNADILISGAITITTGQSGAGQLALYINKSINGNNASSKLVNTQQIYMNNSLYPVPMSTGILDITTSANTFGYIFNGDYIIPYTLFSALYIGGTGTKSLSANTTLSSNLTIATGGTLELLTYDLSVTGISTITGLLSKTGAGNILFVGNVALGTGVNFSGGNPTIEFRGGISNQNNSPTSNFGTGLITFSTNNQNLNNGVSPIQGFTFNNNILINGAITLQTSRTGGGGYSGVFNGTINGNNVNSKFLMGTDTPTINYRNATQPMATGILDTSTNLNTWIYGGGSQDVKGSPTTSPKQVYRNLTLNGGGTKTLQGYVSVLNTYTLTSPATLALNGYTLTNP